MNDPRIVLSKELIKIGISLTDANIIALDTGSSQVSVNGDYLSDFQYSKQIKKLALSLVGKFYSGELFDNIDVN